MGAVPAVPFMVNTKLFGKAADWLPGVASPAERVAPDPAGMTRLGPEGLPSARYPAAGSATPVSESHACPAALYPRSTDAFDDVEPLQIVAAVSVPA